MNTLTKPPLKKFSNVATLQAYLTLRVLWSHLEISLAKASKRKEGFKRDEFLIGKMMPLIPTPLQTDVLWSELLEAVSLKYRQQKKPPKYALILSLPKKMKGGKIEVICSSREEFERTIFKHFPNALIAMYSTLKSDPLPDDEPTPEAHIWESRAVLEQLEDDLRKRGNLLQDRIKRFATLHQIDGKAYLEQLETDLLNIALREADTLAIGFYKRVFNRSDLEFELDHPEN